jgi:endonuclease/exonuclease/phosphatase family metal-dependent hydrolase
VHLQKDTFSTGQDATASACDFSFATWNIHSAIGTDDRMDMRRVTSVIAAIDADVIGLQEVGWHRSHHTRVDQFAFLREHTGYEVVEGLARDPLRSRFGNALLTRLPVVRSWWIDLKVIGHPPRAAVAVDLSAATTPLRVVVTHFGLTPPEREVQAKRLVEAIAPDAPGSVPTVSLGDFNMVRESTRASRLLREHFCTCASAPTYPSRRPVFALDRIYLSAHWKLHRTRVIHTDLSRLVSDHLPLVVEAALAREPVVPAEQKTL